MTAFIPALRDVHMRSLAFAAAVPLVAAIPLIAEFVQHIVEMQIGMYDGPEGAAATADSALRLNFGLAKVIALGLPAYFLVRWLHSSGDRKFAVHLEQPAIIYFALIVALQTLFAWLGLFVWTDGPLGIGFFVFGLVFMPLIVRFIVGAPLGLLISPRQSIRTMLPHAVFAILFPLVAMLPLMILHYALGIGAVFAPGAAFKWGLLAIDSFVTAWLALVMIAAQYVIATRPGPLEPAASTGQNSGTIIK